MMPSMFGLGTFSVYQFFTDKTNEKVRDWCSIEEALKAFLHYSSSVGARLGFVERVIVVDWGDRIVAEWTEKDGVKWPEVEK